MEMRFLCHPSNPPKLPSTRSLHQVSERGKNRWELQTGSGRERGSLSGLRVPPTSVRTSRCSLRVRAPMERPPTRGREASHRSGGWHRVRRLSTSTTRSPKHAATDNTLFSVGAPSPSNRRGRGRVWTQFFPNPLCGKILKAPI